MKGICHLSSIPVRSEPGSKNEIVTELLFGESYEVKEKKDDWFKILTELDRYEGWINEKQFYELIEQFTAKAVSDQYPFVEADSPLGKMLLLPGSVLPGYSNGTYQLNGKSYAISKPLISHSSADILPIAKQYLNAPYLWGGKTPFGIDCSGFVQAVYRICGVWMNRDAWQQAEQGETVESLENVKAADLAFFENASGRITHVGIMLSPTEIIHASGYVRIDNIDQHGIINSETKHYSHTLKKIKRLI